MTVSQATRLATRAAHCATPRALLLSLPARLLLSRSELGGVDASD
jgi:hypothetical protein